MRHEQASYVYTNVYAKSIDVSNETEENKQTTQSKINMTKEIRSNDTRNKTNSRVVSRFVLGVFTPKNSSKKIF